MPYVSQQYLGRTFTAFSVPPDAADGLDAGLLGLNQVQFLIQQEGGLAELAKAVREASDEQISLAQAQLAYALKEVGEGMLSLCVALEDRERGLKALDVRDARDALAKAVRVIVADARGAMKACDRNPGSASKLSLLNSVMETLAEAKVVTATIAKASRIGRDAETARAAHQAFSALAAEADAFRAEVGPRYAPKVLALLDPSEVTLARAAKRAAADMGPLPELTDRRIALAGIDMPDQQQLWLLSKRKPEEIAPLRAGVAAKVRDAVAGVLSDYHETFGAPGFVRLIRAVAVSAHWQSERYAGYANEREKDEDRARRAAEKDRVSHRRGGMSYEEHLESYRGTRSMYAHQGRAMAALAADLRGVLALAARQLRPDLPVERRMSFALDEASGAVVGRFEDEAVGDRALIVYDDAGAGGQEGAVLMVSMGAERLADGVPPINDVRWGGDTDPGIKTSNYISFQDAFSCLGNAFDQRYFMDERFSVVDAASIPVPRAPRAAAPGCLCM